MTLPLRIGVAGLGVVGASVIDLIARRSSALQDKTGRPLVVTGVCARNRDRDRGIDISGARWFDSAIDLASSEDIDVFVEVVGGAEGVARAAVETALSRGKSIVTANKALLAAHGMALARSAEQAHSTLAFEASVAGGVPIIKTLREGLVGNRIERVYGILNGTCNYILSRMETERLPFDVCLSEAQRLGYAEADPSFDIGGFDSAHKLSLLATLAFGIEVDSTCVHIEGIEAISQADIQAADELGYRVKMLGVAQRTPSGIERRVHPTMIHKSSPIANVMGVMNAITINADAIEELTLVGPGAGGEATASAIVADIADIARGARPLAFGIPTEKLKPAPRLPMMLHRGGYFIRLAVHDKAGVMASIAGRMGERGISLESIVQKAIKRNDGASTLCFITHATTESLVREALSSVFTDGHLFDTPQVIRIEREPYHEVDSVHE